MTTGTRPVRASLRDVAALWRSRTPFDANGSLRGVEGRTSSYGRLPADERARYEQDKGRIVFTVLSYATPIAWTLDDGTRVLSRERYSVTTSKHSTMLARGGVS